MKAGPMREWLHVLRPTIDTDDFGSENIRWADINHVHAERVKFSGRRSEEVGEHFPDYSVQFRVRDVHMVEENWRVLEDGGYLYTVLAIEPNVHKGFNTLICERVNE